MNYLILNSTVVWISFTSQKLNEPIKVFIALLHDLCLMVLTINSAVN